MTQDRSGRAVEVLLVEDNPGDVVLTREAFEDARVDIHLSVAADGPSAFAELEGRRTTPGARLPDLVLLDLNLPGMDGHEILRRIRTDDDLRHLPVIIMTTSDRPDDVLDAYRGTANSYITKPLDPDEFLAAVRGLGDYWLRVVELPDSSR